MKASSADTNSAGSAFATTKRSEGEETLRMAKTASTTFEQAENNLGIFLFNTSMMIYFLPYSHGSTLR